MPFAATDTPGTLGLVLQLCADGIALGCLYGLVALGFVLIYRATEVVNFAQGEFLMLGAFVAYSCIELLGWPFWLGSLVAILVLALFGAAVYRLLVHPLVGEGPLAPVVATLGLAFLLRCTAAVVPGWGNEPHVLAMPFERSAGLALGSVRVDPLALVVVGATLLLGSALGLFLGRHRWGLAIRAASENELAAVSIGIPVRRVRTLVWAVAAGAAALAGILLAPTQLIDPNMGWFGLKAFPAAVLGGFASLRGALIGGAVLGVVETQATYWQDGPWLPDGCGELAPWIVLVLCLILRPEGLFGERLRKRA